MPDPRYVADPKTGSRHNRGASVDLTLVDAQGNELPMPTGFDDFSERAHRTFMDQSRPNALKNRALLQSAMEEEGFIGLPSEWWHFDEPQWGNFALRNEPLGSSSSATSPTRSRGTFNNCSIVTSKSWTAQTGQLQRYEEEKPRVAKSRRAMDCQPRDSKAWRGAAGCVRTDRGPGPVKKEGDNTAPAGMYSGLGKPTVTTDSAPVGNRGGPINKSTKRGRSALDDPASACYNKIFRWTRR